MKLNTVGKCLIALSLITLSAPIQAQIAISNDLNINPEVIERSKGLVRGLAKKGVKKAAVETGKKAAPALLVPLLKNPKKTIVAGAVVGGGTYWWYSTTISATVKRMAKNPDDFELYWEKLADDYDKKLEFAQKTWDMYYETTGNEQKTYENLLNLLGYNIENLNTDLVNVDIVIPKTQAEQDELEQSTEFQVELSKVETLAAEIDQRHEHLCRGQAGQRMRENLVKLTPKDFKLLYLMNNNTKTVQFLNVDSYKELEGDRYFLENDHIPSYSALEKYFNVSATNNKGKKIRVYNLADNATALSLPYKMHRHNRTTGRGNEKLGVIDSKNLQIATLLDFATLLTMKVIDSDKWDTDTIHYNDLLRSFSYIYGRNAQLCLYY